MKTLTSRGASTRQRIIEATAHLAYVKGMERTSLDDVRAAAGVSKSQLYHYFLDKDALVREVIAAQTSRVLAAQEPAMQQLDSVSALRRWCECVLGLYRLTGGKGGCPLGSLANELANQSEPTRVLLAAGFDEWADRLSEGFAKMQARGEIGQAAVPGDLALGVLSAVQGGLLLAKTSRSKRPLELALDMALKYVASHVRPRSGSRSRRTSSARNNKAGR